MGRCSENRSPRRDRPAIRQRWHILAVLAATIVADGTLIVAVAGEGARATQIEGASAPAPAVRVYIDPATGRLTAPPAGSLPPEANPRNVLPSPAREVQNTGPAGGFMLDTKGLSFDVEATVDPSGTPTVHCDPPSPANTSE